MSFYSLNCFAQEPAEAKVADPDLAGYKTVAEAEQTTIGKTNFTTGSNQAPYAGIYVEQDDMRQVIAAVVDTEGPAYKSGIREGDLLTKIDDQTLESPGQFRESVQQKLPGEKVKLTVSQNGNSRELELVLGATSRPLSSTSTETRPFIGLRLGEAQETGVRIEQVTPNSPAERGGVKIGDLLVKIDDAVLSDTLNLAEALAGKSPGDKVRLLLKREQEEEEIEIELAAAGSGFGGGGRNDRSSVSRALGGVWRKDVYKLAIITVEFPDIKHNEKINLEEWHESLFSDGTYRDKKNATGRTVYGSLNDYYKEQSYGKFHVEGKVFDWVEMSKKRSEYSTGTGTGSNEKTVFLREAMDKLLQREGKDALKGFDGVFVLFAGDRVRTTRGGLYWPHRGTVTHQGKRWPYFIVQEGGSQMTNISVMCHEFGHMLGLPDLYARPENPGSEGVSVWCAMSNQAGNGRPQHFSAWCKEQLGWIKPAVIDPAGKQKLILSPIEDSPNECYKVLVRPDGSEYLLLENRRMKGFDASLPSEGLLIWRVVNNKPVLEESHGVEGPAGPGIYRDLVPYPSRANNSFTPFTTPSSRAKLGGGKLVHISNIRELPDGRITFLIGYEFN